MSYDTTKQQATDAAKACKAKMKDPSVWRI
jgi:hypothetical protein